MLSIPPDQRLWMPAEHATPLRVSGMQTGNFSGPVGSTTGQQPLAGGSVVREEQETFWGFTPEYGRLEMRARMMISPRSMAAWWMVGLEDRPERCAEICVVEVFGSAVEPGRSAEVGMGLKEFRDPEREARLRGTTAADRCGRVPRLRGRLDGRQPSSSSTVNRSAPACARRRTRCR